MTGAKTLVLGGGGIAGLGWFAGLLRGLYDNGVDLRDADRMIGTSAGSATAAQLRSSQSIETLFARQTDPTLIADEPPPSMEALTELLASYPATMAIADQAERIAAMGELASREKSVTSGVRRAMIERRLSEHEWPESPLTITAVDIESGALICFDRSAGVSLIDAVSASCSVPGVWPVVAIGGRNHMDGGVYSSDNAHLAQGSQRVLIASPLGGVMPFPAGFQLTDEVAMLEASGSRVLAICPDSAARAAMGRNPLDPAVRAPSALAGREQGRSLASEVANFWK
ncbi:patatin-like phospholipase family protein [Novosphingobium sp.]|uniref:patatin-like phospholipase family protein n=1 Tax=Novosphingobium sp. TaxID=1874826 RepID=UPI002736B9ED|nr:patatin-like phospholipase family protein [Novosphingobium sp.]MDP3905965.1 patatin-like phospholipase family protein [Novosphingobium sp.]